MASPPTQRGIRSNQDTYNYCQELTSSVEKPATPCSGKSPFLQASDYDLELDQEENHQVVVESNDLPISDMDLAGFLEMDEKTLSDLTGVNTTEWNSLFNGQLDDVNSLDPMTGIQSTVQDTTAMVTSSNPQFSNNSMSNQPPGMDRWLLEETQKLERQQKLQQQKLMELQQTLLKTEILKNQLQIATISQAQSPPTMSTTSSLLLGSLNLPQNENGLQQSDSVDDSPSFNFVPSPTASENAKSLGLAKLAVPLQMKMSPMDMSVSGSVTSRGGRMSTSSSSKQSDIMIDVKPPKSSLFSPPPSPVDPEFPEEEPSKRKVHNLIEKKYRCSINDRICMLRDMVSKNGKDTNKRLQKSAVLQKTIDFINHLQNTIKKLQDENQHLRESLAIATGKSRVPSFSSPPSTPSVSPRSCESEGDSGHPSSPDDYTSDGGLISRGASPTGRASFFNQFLRNNPIRGNNASQYLMVVMLTAVFFINPFSDAGPGGPVVRMMASSPGSVRTLNSFEGNFEPNFTEARSSVDTMIYFGFWIFRIFVAALCFGWITLKSMPRVMTNSRDSVQYWRFRKQAEMDIQKGEFASARDSLEMALSVIKCSIPTSYIGMVVGLLWSLFSHVLFQLVIGQCAVFLASVLVRHKSQRDVHSPKKPVIGVTFDSVSETYHLLHQINLSSFHTGHLNGTGFFLGLNALNFAEADRPFHRLSKQKLAEMYFTMGLQCQQSIPLLSNLLMRYYLFCFHNVIPAKHATPLKWTLTQPGREFLMSAKWSSEMRIGSRLYLGNAALPLYSITRAYCKEVLCETFGYLLLPDDSPDSQASRDSESVLQTLKLILKLAKEANLCLLNANCSEKTVREAAGCSDSGFGVIQWWASVGIVSCYWSAGNNKKAEDYYSDVESRSEEMGSALQLAFKANRMYKRSSNGPKIPLDVILQLCSSTSNSLESSVVNLLQDHSYSTENKLHQLGLLLASDWLLNLKVTLWENHGKEGSLSRDICPGFYQDLETLSKLATLLPSARSRLHLYKGCYQLIAGANPIVAHTMLKSTGSASLVRRRTNSKDTDAENPAMYSHEHAMAKFMAYKHLPPSMELPQNPPPFPSPSMASHKT